MADAYCGVGKIPKDKRRGNMKECAEQGQVRYFGLKKIDQRLIDHAKTSKKSSVSKRTVVSKWSTLKARRKRLDGEIESTKDKTKKEQLKAEYKKVNEEYKKAELEMKKIGMMRHTSRSHSRHSSRPKSRTHSRKSHSRHSSRPKSRTTSRKVHSHTTSRKKSRSSKKTSRHSKH